MRLNPYKIKSLLNRLLLAAGGIVLAGLALVASENPLWRSAYGFLAVLCFLAAVRR